jgi:hypothetical protein
MSRTTVVERTCTRCPNATEPRNRLCRSCIAAKHASPADRFARQVDVSGGPGACWPWKGKLSDGYGTLWVAGKMRKAHRVAWELAHGPLPNDATGPGPSGTCVLHRCDNRRCCNPSHLFLGTHRENIADMVAKGRAAKRPGANSPGAKLCDADVIRIRQRCAAGETRRSVAADYALTPEAVSAIALGKTWKHLLNGAVVDQFCRQEDGE